MLNLLEKIRKGDHSSEDKIRKVHTKWKRFCCVRNQEYVVPEKRRVVDFALSNCH